MNTSFIIVQLQDTLIDNGLSHRDNDEYIYVAKQLEGTGTFLTRADAVRYISSESYRNKNFAGGGFVTIMEVYSR